MAAPARSRLHGHRPLQKKLRTLHAIAELLLTGWRHETPDESAASTRTRPAAPCTRSHRRGGAALERCASRRARLCADVLFPVRVTARPAQVKPPSAIPCVLRTVCFPVRHRKCPIPYSALCRCWLRTNTPALPTRENCCGKCSSSTVWFRSLLQHTLRAVPGVSRAHCQSRAQSRKARRSPQSSKVWLLPGSFR